MIPKNKRGGTVNAIIVGVGGLVVLTVITFIVVSTVLNADLLENAPISTVTNETMPINATGSLLANWKEDYRDFTITLVVNTSGDGYEIANYSFDSTNGRISSTTVSTYDSANVSYTYYANNQWEDAVISMKYNTTSGIQNVSTKVPTILLIAAVVLLFGVLMFLIARAKQMGVGNIGGQGGL